VEQPGGDGEGEQEGALAADALPVHQDQRQHAPDGDVVEAGIAQDALADGLAQDVELLHEQDQDGQRGHRTGHADADDELPGLRLLPHPAIETEHQGRRPAAEKQRRTERQAGGDAALAAMRPGFPEVEFDAGDHHEQHHRPPGDAVQRLDDGRVEDELVIVGKTLPRMPGPSRMPVMIWTTTSGA
jgi:hypothetical protein